jgi:pantoate--beta-alanine ligase
MSSPHDASLPVAKTVAALRARVKGWRTAGERIALVPTMGALHDGHMSLVRLAKAQADRVVVSIFVNPRQFAPTEDFATYPRPEEADARRLVEARVDLLYAPEPSEMYPAGFSTQVNLTGVSEPLEGASRPHFFSGVATVVTKLLIQCAPDIAIFGEKDYQQLQVIRRLVRDLDIPVEVLSGATERDIDGLALSSRNAYLSAAERKVAVTMNRVLADAAAALASGAAVAEVETRATEALLAAGFDRVDYVEVRAADDLRRFGDAPDAPARILAAAWLGKTRLIDNVAAAPPA